MKYILPIFLFMFLVLVACEKEYFPAAESSEPVVLDPNDTIFFATVIQPILTSKCAVSGCHVAGRQVPDLSAANSWNGIQAYVDPGDAENCRLYKFITSTSSDKMPPSGKLSSLQIAQILNWIKQGALNN